MRQGRYIDRVEEEVGHDIRTLQHDNKACWATLANPFCSSPSITAELKYLVSSGLVNSAQVACNSNGANRCHFSCKQVLIYRKDVSRSCFAPLLCLPSPCFHFHFHLYYLHFCLSTSFLYWCPTPNVPPLTSLSKHTHIYIYNIYICIYIYLHLYFYTYLSRPSPSLLLTYCPPSPDSDM